MTDIDKQRVAADNPFVREAMMEWTGQVKHARYYTDSAESFWQAEWRFTFSDGWQETEWRRVADMVPGEMHNRIQAAIDGKVPGGKG